MTRFRAESLTPEVVQIVEELQLETTTNRRRWEIGLRLAEIGDPRPGVGAKNGKPDILWRPIPGGVVEIEGHGPFAVQPFHMAAFPVTIAQFRAFLEDKSGYDDKRWWQDLKCEGKENAWQGPLANHPVTNVSWYDATAFCRWFSARLGFEVRLPDEWEWQWAAQSAQTDFRNPWGPDWKEGFANTSESKIHRAIAVGMYPRGDSRQEVSDLAGNVWDWCRNEYGHPRTTAPGGKESRVLRGGSWVNFLYIARADARYGAHPGVRNDGDGFRVVCSSPIR